MNRDSARRLHSELTRHSYACRADGDLERIDAKLDCVLLVLREVLDDLSKPHPGSLPIELVVTEKPMDPIILPEHKTFSNRKTQVLFSPTYQDPEGNSKPDADAVVTVSSSDPSQVGVDKSDAGTFITTPLDAGSATITITATSPNAEYAPVQLPFSYTAPIAGQLNVTLGADVLDS